MTKAKDKKPSVGTPHQQAIDIIASGYDQFVVCTELAKHHPDLFVRLALPTKKVRNTVATLPQLANTAVVPAIVPVDARRPLGWQSSIIGYIKRGEPVTAIKSLREATLLGLKEAKDIVDAIRTNLADRKIIPLPTNGATVVRSQLPQHTRPFYDELLPFAV